MKALYAGHLSLKAILHRPLPALVSALGLAAVLAPLLILYGLKSGIVDGLISDLKRDPSILRVSLVGNRPLGEHDIQVLRARPQVGFVVGSPRALATRMEMSKANGSLESVVAEWVPSGDGDPLLPVSAGLDLDQIAIAEPLAERLGLTVGDGVLAFAYRNNEAEVLEFSLTVLHVLPRHLLAGNRVLAHAEVVGLVGAFHDHYAIPEHGLPGKDLASRTVNYDSLRLYAASVDDVVALDRIMGDLGFRAESQAANIEWVRMLDTAMTGVFVIISVAGVAGFALSLWANVTSNLRQYRGQISLLRLLGLGAAPLSVFPAVQVAVTTTLGLVLSAAGAGLVAFIINRIYLVDLFADSICKIQPGHIAAAAAVSYAIALLVVLQQIHALNSISPSEALAENV